MNTTVLKKELLKNNEVTSVGNRNIAISCGCLCLLFMARGAINPYFFPIYERLTDFSYYQIALLLNVYMCIQAIASPLTGKIADTFNVTRVVFVFLALYIIALLVPICNTNFLINILAILLLGTCLIALKNTLFSVIINNVSTEKLRRTIAIRSMLVNIGSYTGNTIALYAIIAYGAKQHLMIIMVMLLIIGALFSFKKVDSIKLTNKNSIKGKYGDIWKDRGFISDALYFFAAMLPYGCWGTIIPKYVIDTYSSEAPIVYIYGISVSTTLICSYFINSAVIRTLYKRGFKWTWCKWLACLLFLIGLCILTYCKNYMYLGIAVFIFILGEILIMPYSDELAKKYTDKGKGETGAYLGILGLFSGAAILAGSTIALTIYGIVKDNIYRDYFWFIMLVVYIALICCCFTIASYIRRSVLSK